jgi:cation diffusion facilitator CzcD-associated flavoprotein CzcO
LTLGFQLSAPGCKRIIADPQYLQSLKRPNVNLKWDAIEAVVEDGIKLKTGVFIPLDVIIFGTGFALVCIHMNHDSF